MSKSNEMQKTSYVRAIGMQCNARSTQHLLSRFLKSIGLDDTPTHSGRDGQKFKSKSALLAKNTWDAVLAGCKRRKEGNRAIIPIPHE